MPVLGTLKRLKDYKFTVDYKVVDICGVCGKRNEVVSFSIKDLKLICYKCYKDGTIN